MDRAGNEAVLHALAGGDTDGEGSGSPHSGLVRHTLGNLYSTTLGCDPAGNGTVLHRFPCEWCSRWMLPASVKSCTPFLLAIWLYRTTQCGGSDPVTRRCCIALATRTTGRCRNLDHALLGQPLRHGGTWWYLRQRSGVQDQVSVAEAARHYMKQMYRIE